MNDIPKGLHCNWPDKDGEHHGCQLRSGSAGCYCEAFPGAMFREQVPVKPPKGRRYHMWLYTRLPECVKNYPYGGTVTIVAKEKP
jgi:hypothetical protein